MTNRTPPALPENPKALVAVLNEWRASLAEFNGELLKEMRAATKAISEEKAEVLKLRGETTTLAALQKEQNGNVADVKRWQVEQEQIWREHLASTTVQHLAVDARGDEGEARTGVHEERLDTNEERLDVIEGERAVVKSADHDNETRRSVWTQAATMIFKGAAYGAGGAGSVSVIAHFFFHLGI